MPRLRPIPVATFVLVLGALLLLQGGVGVLLKVREDRTDDLVHNGLHAVTGLVAVGAAATGGARAATRFALGFGAAYLALGLVGWAWTNPFGVLPLGAADHVFHTLLGASTLGVGVVARRAATPAAASSASGES